MPNHFEKLTLSTNDLEVELICHFSENGDRQKIVEDSKTVARQILENMDELVTRAHALHSQDIKCNTYVPYKISTREGLEPTLYLRNTQSERDDEIHVFVDSDYKFAHSAYEY